MYGFFLEVFFFGVPILAFGLYLYWLIKDRVSPEPTIPTAKIVDIGVTPSGKIEVE